MQTSLLGIGYAYDSSLSYVDHLRIADSARAGGAVASEAADRGARRVEKGIAAAASQITGAVSQVTDAVNEVSAEIRAATEVMQWGFSSVLDEMAEMRTTLDALLKCARNPSQTWAYEQFDIARDNFQKGNYEDCLKRLAYAIDGYQTYLGYPEGWQFHQLKGDIYLQCPKRSLIDLPKAEKCFLAAAKYADTSNERAMALTAAAVAAYNQGRMEAAEDYAQQACKASRELADAHFQLARIRLNRCNYGEAWRSALQAITLDHRYAARLPLDSEFKRNAKEINPAWRQYAKDLKARLESAAQSATATMHELAKSREETDRMRNSRAFKFFGKIGTLYQAGARFQEMTELVNKLSPEAEKSLKRLQEKLHENSVFAFLTVELEMQRANDLATGALSASREAEYTLRKVELLSHGLPSSFPLLLPSAIFSVLSKRLGALLAGGFAYSMIISVGIVTVLEGPNGQGDKVGHASVLLLVILSYLIGVVTWVWPAGNREANKVGTESFDWSAANGPQTTAKTDGNILRANEALRRSAKPDHPDGTDDGSFLF